MRELRLPQAFACATPFMVLACSLVFILFTSIGAIAQCDPDEGSIEGTVFMDAQTDGTFSTGEPGISNVMVTAYDADGVSLGFALSDEEGEYTISNLVDGEKVSLIFSYANTLSPGVLGPDNASNVQYTIVPSCNNNLGLIDLSKDCGTNPEILLTCFSQGTYNGVNKDLETILGIEHNFTNSSQPTVYARAEETGSVWGLAWKNTTGDIFSSSFVKQYSGLKDGPGAVYKTTYNGSEYETTLFADLSTLGVNVAPLINTDVFDCDYGAQVGKYGLGSIVLSPDEQWLYTVNLSDNTLVKFSSINPRAATTTITPIPDPGCGNGDARAFALVFRDDDLYVGVTCTAETSYLNGGLPSQLELESSANVFKYTPDNGNWNLEFTTNYIKGYWRDDFEDSYKTIHWLTDIDFTDEGNMLISLTDRVGHRFCNDAERIDGQNPDLLVVFQNATGQWELENNGQIMIDGQSVDGTGVGNTQGPGGGEFFAYEHWITDPAYHAETALGSIVVLPGSGSVVAMVYDPIISSYSGGMHRYNTSNGEKISAKQLYTRDFTANLGKATGFGNLVIRCGEKPLEIGNYVWYDDNNNGNQDADESGFPGLALELLDTNCDVIGTTTTDVRGYYVFNISNVDRDQDGVFDGLMPNAEYYVKVAYDVDDSGLFYNIGSNNYFVCANGTGSSNQTNCDINILDGICDEQPVVEVKTGEFGISDHSFDIGLYLSQEFDLALKKEIIGNPIVTYGSILNYKITLVNQGDLTASNIKVVDYLTDAYSFDESINPGWQLIDDKLLYTYFDELSRDESAEIYLRLQIHEYQNSNDLLNYAEISSANDPSGQVDRDLDSFFDEIDDNDNGGVYNTDTDNEMDDDGVIDEDDHDVAGSNVFDLALKIENKVEGEYYKLGDKVDFVITVFNQGLVDAQSFGVVNYIPEGLSFDSAENQGWNLNGDLLSLTETAGIKAGTIKEYCVSFVIEETGNANDIIQFAEISSATAAGGVASVDYDSQPDNIPDNDKGGTIYTAQDNLVTDNGVIDEDDHDPVVVRLRNIDLALRKTAITSAAVEGEPASFKIEVINQGTETVSGFKVVDFFPEELILTDSNWTATGNKAFRRITVPGGLKQGESYPLTITFNIATGTNLEPIINYAEIYQVFSMDGEDISLFDIDSTPDGINDNDSGGQVNTVFDDYIGGTKSDDEDDHDPAQMVFVSGQVTSNCECTDPVAGFFTNEIVITAEDGQNWVVDQALGVFDTTSTSGNFVNFAAGTMGHPLTVEDVVGIEDNYVLRFYSLDGHSWQLNLKNEQGIIVPLQGAACNNSFIAVSGASALCTATTELYTVTNPTAGDTYTFSLPAGSGTLTKKSDISAEVEWSVNGGPFQLSVSNNGTNTDCQSPTIVGGQGVMVGTSTGALSCIGHTNVSLNGSCELLVKPSTISSQSLDPSIPYSVMLTLPDGTIVPDNILTGEHVGLLVEAKLIEGCGNNACWGTITVEDKLGPVFNCEDTEVFCFNLDEYEGPLAMDACDGPVAVEWSIEETEYLPDHPDFISKITRTYIAEDSKGNTATPCIVDIYVKRLKFSDITWPDDITGTDALICTDLDESGVPSLEVSKVPTVFGYPLLPAENNICDFTLMYEDREETHYGCITSIMREYTAIFWDPQFGTYVTDTHTQEIEVEDDNDPIFQPLDNIVVTAGFDNCTQEVTILYPEGLDDQCSKIDQIDIYWAPSDPSTIGGTIPNVDFPVVIELPLGESLVTYRAYDDCNNSSTTSINVTVNPNTGPTASCKDLNIALGSGNNGFAYVTAASIDKSNSPICGSIVSRQVRRLDDGANCYTDPATGENVPTTEYGDYVVFCCEDAGKQIMVQLQIIDNYGGIGSCMSMITVQDPNAPTVSKLLDESIECGSLFTTEELELLNDNDPDNDVDLSQFGFPVIYDECGTADTVVTASWEAMGDCGTGTIIRTFTASDTNNEASSTQTITVTKDPFLDSYIEQFEVLDTNICDLTLLVPELLPVPFNGPQITGEGPCDDTMISMTSEDVYTFPEDDSDYCFKIIRNWTILSWCDRDMDNNPLTFHRQQIIRITNTEGPEILNAPLEDITECVEEGEVSAFVDVVVRANDDCTIPNNIEWSYTLYNTSTDPETIVEDSPYAFNFGDSIDVSGEYDTGDYRLDFAFRDRCGNEVTGEQIFLLSGDYCFDVEDCVGLLSDVDINLTACDYPQDVDELVGVISIIDSGVPDIDCTECMPINTTISDILIDSPDELICDTIIRTLTLEFECPTGPNRFVERSHSLVLHNTNDPIIVVPATPAIALAESNCEAFVAVELATSMDGCSTGVEITNDSPYADPGNDGDDASGTYPVGEWLVTFTATDLCGNATSESITISVTDAEAPVCNSQNITLIFFDTDEMTINADTLDNGSTDSCVENEDLIFTVSQSTFTCEDFGNNELMLTVSDGILSNSCAVTVEVLDSVPPICITQDVTVYIDESGQAMVSATMIDNGSESGCQGIDPASQNVNPSMFNCEDIGVITTIDTNGDTQIEFRDTTVYLINVFTSGSVNQDSCTATVTFIDTIGPTCNVVDITVNVGDEVEGIDFDNGSTDNCGGALTFDVNVDTPFTCDDVDMLNPVEVTVTDRFGNTTICEANVTVLSPIEIMCVAIDTTLYLDSSGQASVTPNEIGYQSSAQCGLDLIFELDPSDFVCNDALIMNGEVEITLTVSVDGSNEDPVMCNSTITLLDTIAPSITCLLPQTVSCNDFDETLESYGTISIDNVDDNCSSGVTIQDTVFEEINVCGIGTYTRRWIATDAADNSDTCEQVITVILGDNPLMEEDLTFPSDTLFFGDCSAFDPDNLDTTVGIDSMAAECFNVSIDFVDMGINMDMPCNDTITRLYTVIDSCQLVAGTNAGIFEFEQTIIINDTTAPIIFGISDMTVTVQDTMTCTFPLDLSGFDVDNCDENITVTATIDTNGVLFMEIPGGDASGDYEVGEYEITLTATDDCNNSNSYSYSVTVLDTTYVYFTCRKIILDMEADTSVDVNAIQVADTIQFFNCLGTTVDTLISWSATDINDTIRAFGCESVNEPQRSWIYLWLDGEVVDSCRGGVQLDDPDDLCMDDDNGLVGTVIGSVFTSDDEPVPGVHIDLDGSGESIMTDEEGMYAFPDMIGGEAYEVIPTKDDDPMNGVTTLDLILIQRHILGLSSLDSPYDLIAADIDASGSLSGIDIIQLRKLILGIYDVFPDNTSWRMVDRGFSFWDPDHAEEEDFPETYNIEALISTMKADFIGVKTGDVNGSVSPGIIDQNDADTRSNNTWYLQAKDRKVKAGESVAVEISVSENIDIQGFQLAIETSKIRDISLSSSNITITEDNYFVDKYGVVNISWNSINHLQLTKGSSVIELEIEPSVDGKLSEMLSISEEGVESQAYFNNAVTYDSAEIFWNADRGEFALYQNTPNPWTQSTDISFMIPNDGEVTIYVRSVNGQLIKTFNGYYKSGLHSVKLNDEDLIESGVYYYEMRYDNQVVLEKMILMR